MGIGRSTYQGLGLGFDASPYGKCAEDGDKKLMKNKKRKTHQVETSFTGSKTSCQLTPPAMLMNKLNIQLVKEPPVEGGAAYLFGLLRATTRDQKHLGYHN